MQPRGDPPPAPPAVQPPPPELALGAVRGRPRGEPGPPSQPPPRSPSPPVAALLSSHRRTGRTLESAAPPPPRFFFLSLLWDLAAGAWRGSEKRREKDGSAGFRCGARTERGAPASPPGPRRPGWDVTKESPQRLPPALEGAPRRAHWEHCRSLCARSAAGREWQGALGPVPSSHSSERAAGEHRFPGARHNSGASSARLDRVPLPADSPGVGDSACPPALPVALASRHLRRFPTPKG